MLTNNYYAMVRNWIGANTSNAVELKGIRTDNYESNISAGNLFFESMNVLRAITSKNSSNINTGVILGNGTSEPTVDDYSLSGDSISTFAYSSTVVSNIDSSPCAKTATYTITNTGDEDIIISEIGYVYYTNGSFLLDHTLLDEPLTIPAGGVGQLTYTITFNIANA